MISSVASTTQRTVASITWNTDELSDSKVIYGLTTDYGSETSLDSTLTRIHSATLSGLAPATIYRYKVISADASGNRATSTGYSLITESLSLTSIVATTISNTSTGISWTTSDNSNFRWRFHFRRTDRQRRLAVIALRLDDCTALPCPLCRATYYYRVVRRD